MNKFGGKFVKPAAMKDRDGDTRKAGANKLKQQIAAEPKAEKGLPPCPRHLRYRAKEAWQFWVRELEFMNLDRRPDKQMLEGACLNYARAIQAETILAKDGITVNEYVLDKEGEPFLAKIRKHPAVDIVNAAWRQVRGFCGEFGLSPVSRARLAVDRGDKNDEADLMKMLMQPREAKKKPESAAPQNPGTVQ